MDNNVFDRLNSINERLEAEENAKIRDEAEKQHKDEELNKKAIKRFDRVIILLVVGALLIFAVFKIANLIKTDIIYNSAVASYKAGNDIEAYEKFEKTGIHRKTIEYQNKIIDAHKNDEINVLVGRTFEFGSITVGEDGYSSETYPLKWETVKYEEDRVLVILENVIDLEDAILARGYTLDTDRRGKVWSELVDRECLNDEFYNTAFTESEKAKILETDFAGKTKDKIFLFSADEIDKYCPREVDKRASRLNELTFSYHQLRVDKKGECVYVTEKGKVEKEKNTEMGPPTCCRPAMWISLE